MLNDLGLATLVPDVGADLVCEGHTHWPVDRTVAGVRVVNAGSVSNPAAMGLRASYALVEATTAGYQVEHRRVAYDLEVVIAAIEWSHHPAGEYIRSHFRGQRRPWWLGGEDGREFHHDPSAPQPSTFTELPTGLTFITEGSQQRRFVSRQFPWAPRADRIASVDRSSR